MLVKTIAPLLFVFINFAFSQSIDTIQLNTIPMGSIVKTHLNFGVDNFGAPRTIPVLVAKGKTPGPVLGLTAAIHGNELNGIAIIHKLFDTLDVTQLSGTVIAIPGLNPVGISDNTRDFKQEGDLNRIFPGKKMGVMQNNGYIT